MTYPISTPVIYEINESSQNINFQATGGTSNVIQNFVTTTRGDMIVCLTGGTTNTLDRIAIGPTNTYLKVIGGIPVWSNFDTLKAIKTTTQAINGSTGPLPLQAALILGGWSLTNITGTTGGFANDGFSPQGPFDTSSGIFTVPSTGTYYFSSDIRFTQNNANGSRTFAFVRSPTGAGAPGEIIYYKVQQPPAGTTAHTVGYETIAELNINDRVGIEFIGSRNGANITIQPGTTFSVMRIR